MLASRLGKTITEESRLPFDKVVYFIDSMIVLAWIHSQARSFKTLVSNRIAEVHSNSNPAEWRYIPGDVSVADDVSRGISVQDLSHRWKPGPAFLTLPEEQWPQTNFGSRRKRSKRGKAQDSSCCYCDYDTKSYMLQRFL